MLPDESNVKPFKENQIYGELHEQCLKDGCNFEDPEFPACESSLAVATRGLNIEWKRPKDIMDGAVFLTDPSPSDVIQGDMDDCWFLAPVGFLTQKSDLFRFVVPTNQDFDTGILHFRFWKDDDEVWVDVVIDDRLPVQLDETGNWNLIYARSGKDKQYWCPLLEKAFAKLLNSSYQNLCRGNVAEGLKYLTSYNCLEEEISEDNTELPDKVIAGVENGSFMAFTVKETCLAPQETSSGFRRRHIYTICEVSHDDSDGKWLKIHDTNDSVDSSTTIHTRSLLSGLSEENGLLSMKKFCQIGEIFSMSET